MDTSGNEITSRADIKHVVYINLNNRPDRKIQIESELYSMEISHSAIRRFSAIELQDGALGCSLSHLKCIQQAKMDNLPHIMVVEDDLKITDINKFNVQFDKLLQTNSDWDVVILAGNNVGPYKILSDSAVKISKCQTTTGYLVKSTYYDTLIENFKNGINLLMSNPTKRILYAIDKFWFSLQSRDNWLIVYPLLATQRPNYSNIERKYTNYDFLMLVLDKSQYGIRSRYTPINTNQSQLHLI